MYHLVIIIRMQSRSVETISNRKETWLGEMVRGARREGETTYTRQDISSLKRMDKQ